LAKPSHFAHLLKRLFGAEFDAPFFCFSERGLYSLRNPYRLVFRPCRLEL
jgi:hypothetical protein